MARAMVQSSCEKLRSAIVDRATMRLNFTGNLEEMLEQLEAIDAVIPNAERWASMACEPEDTNRGDVQERQSKDEDADRGDVQELKSEVEDANRDDVQELQPEVEDADRGDVQELQSEVEDADRGDVQELQSEVEDADHGDVQELQLEVQDADRGDVQELQSEVDHSNRGDVQELQSEVEDADRGDVQGLQLEVENADRGDVQGLQLEVEDADRDDVQVLQSEVEDVHGGDVLELQPEVEDADYGDVQGLQSEVEDADRGDVQELQSEVEHGDRDDAQKWQSKVEKAANMVCHMVDELQEMTVPLAPTGKKMARMLRRRENIVIDPERKEIMLNKMKEITEKLRKLHNESVQFDDEGDIRALLQAPEAAVGREADLRRILARLSAGLPFGEKGPFILRIINGGDDDNLSAGRATMAALIFNHNRFKFYSRIWINRSDLLSSHEIGKHVISQLVPAGEEEMTGAHVSESQDDMVYRLHELLNGKKVLIVLTNLNDSYYAWRDLKDMLSGGTAGGTEVIVIATGTTYEEDRAMEIFGVEPYCLDPLSDEMCCRIIKQVAIRSQDHTSADKEDLERIAPQAANLCDGSPLKAQLYGAALQFKQYTKWAEQENFTNGPMQLLFAHMSPDLRLCFDYCAFALIRPRERTKEDLINQWIALDLIEPSAMFSTPQLAEQYLKKLLDMSLLQTAKSSPTSAKYDTCGILITMHQSVQKFALELIDGKLELEDEDCDLYYYTEHFSYALFSDQNNKEMKSILADQKIRALHCLGCSKMKPRANLFSSATCLRVLDLHESSMKKLPDSICQLMHLGYLKLSGWSGLVTLPESIGDLINLVHIDLSACSGLVYLPGSFGKLINLVHVSLSGCSKLENLPESFRKLIRLVYIDLSGSALVHLPEYFRRMINLVHINLSGCLALANLPRSLRKLTKLEHMNLSGCPTLVNLPGPFGKLTKLVDISLSGCNGLKTLPESFGKMTKLEHVNLSGCNALEALPGSFGKLTNLVDIDLSGCNGLVNLPGSFGELRNLVHVNLSGCYGLEELPQSFGKLISLVQINLSGCSGLATLPGSFGALKNLLHIDLSHCYGLSKLPRSFGKLKKLVHLDLSFCSCFEGIHTALDGLINLEHLNLSRPCCYRADYHHLKELKEVLSQFIRLKHLNLSMFLNPIFCNQSEEQNLEYIEFISGLSRLEYLDLSHNIFLRDLHQSLSGLGRLHTLDLSGCIKLKKVGQWMGSIKSLRSVVLSELESYQFVVGLCNVINNYGQLVDVSCKELEITCLEKMESVEEAQRIRLADKQNLQKLKLCWDGRSYGISFEEDNDLLGELVPPHGLLNLELHGYRSKCFPSWLTSPSKVISFDLVEITMEDIPNCRDLPPLGLLPNLQRVVLRRMNSITRINAGELSGGNRAAFSRLSKFFIDDMGRLEEFTNYSGGGGGCDGGGNEFLFPVIDELDVRQCPHLSFVPLPPRAQRLVISECNDVMVCWRNRAGRDGVEGPSCISSPVTEVTELVVQNCWVYLGDWCLLNHLPGLRSLTIRNCNNLESSPEIVGALSSLEMLCFSDCDWMLILPEHLGGLSSLRELQIESCRLFESFPDSMRHLTSLQSLHFSDCDSMEELPTWLGNLTSLQKLTIKRCRSIESLPPSIGENTSLKDLHILDCYRLERWCREEEHKKFLGHILRKFEDTNEQQQQGLEIEECESEQSDSEQSGSESD